MNKGLEIPRVYFEETEVELYSKKEKIRYYCIDLLWGQKLYQELRFVLVEMDGSQSILASTSVVLNPLSIIRLYSYRFQIEYTFKELKQQIGAFCYHFWSKYMPKISYYQKKGEPTPMELVAGEKPRKKVLEAVRAIEMHMVLSCIAIGILQSPSISLIGKVNSSQIRYQRTPSRGRVSEATLMYYFRKHFFRLLGQKPELYITQIIQGMQNEPAKPWDSMVS